MSKVDIRELYSLLSQFSLAVSSVYEGKAKDNLNTYKELMAKVKDLPNSDLLKIMRPQMLQLEAFYKTHIDLVNGDRILQALNKDNFNLYIKQDSPSFIPVSDASIEACINKSTEAMNNIEGYMYSMLKICLDDSSAIDHILNKYTKNIPDLGELGTDIDNVAAGLMSKISINDPEVQNKAQAMGSIFMESLKDVVSISIIELNKQGLDITSTDSMKVSSFMPILASLVRNPNITSVMEASINKMGGQAKLGQMLNDVINPSR